MRPVDSAGNTDGCLCSTDCVGFASGNVNLAIEEGGDGSHFFIAVGLGQWQ